MPQKDANCRIAFAPQKKQQFPAISNVVLVGAGALGAQLALEFTRLSSPALASVKLIDPDVLESGNVPSSPAWSEVITRLGIQTIGQPKAALLADHCRSLAPQLRWTALPAAIADIGWKVLQAADLILTCTDSVLSRAETAYAARMLCKPMIDLGVHGTRITGGRIAFFPPQTQAACYACGLTAATRAATLEYIASPSLRCATLPLTEAMHLVPEAAASVSLVATHLAQQLPHILAQQNAYAVRVSPEGTETVALSASAECPWHHHPRLIGLPDHRPIRESLAPGDVLLLPWALALKATCEACGAQHPHPVRVAAIRQGARCLRCGATALCPVHVVDRIASDDHFAERTPLEMGLPSENVLPARKRIQPN